MVCVSLRNYPRMLYLFYLGLEEGILLMCFSDLRQLIDLFVAWDWATYFAEFGEIKLTWGVKK